MLMKINIRRGRGKRCDDMEECRDSRLTKSFDLSEVNLLKLPFILQKEMQLFFNGIISIS